MLKNKRICFVVAVPETANAFLKSHILCLSKDYDIYVAGNFQEHGTPNIEGVTEYFSFPINRSISPFKDLKALFRLYRYFRRMRFDAIHSVTPKAGLITSLAGRLAGIKHRTHIFTGQVWATRKGFMRTTLKSIDKVIARLSNHILVDGYSQRNFLIEEGVISDKKSRVLGAGSICGADTNRFTPNTIIRKDQRRELGFTDDQVVFCFMGRLTADKGIYELLSAFDLLVQTRPNAFLLIFGKDEENCLASLEKFQHIKPAENFLFYGRTTTPHTSLQAADVFCMPSYREGFGLSVVEASSLGLPVICSDAYGLADTMVDNVTGLRCKVGDVPTLTSAMEYMYDHFDKRLVMGAAGRERVLDLFAGEKIVGAWVDFYKSILG